MTRLHKDLAELAAAGEEIVVGIVGVGRMGRSIALCSEEMSGITVRAIADIDLERARSTFTGMGRDDDEITTVEDAAAGDAALLGGDAVVTRDGLTLPTFEEVDVVIEATGVPQIGAQVGLRAIFSGTHIVMLTDETDAVVGPYLSKLAENAGVVYSGAAGDEPGSVMELYNFARALGFEVVAAGKGKNNPLDRSATPASLEAEAAEKNLNPRIYTAFVDGTNTMLEMTMVANATGLGLGTRGMHGPEVSSVQALADVFATGGDEGILETSGVVDYALGGDVAPGVFVVVTTDNDTVREDLEYLKIGDGPNYVLHRTYHIPTLEPLLTAARAELYHDAHLIPEAPYVDTVTVAKRDLSPGEEIDGIGGETVYGLTETAETVKANDLVPISLVHDATVTNEVDQGEPLSYDDLELADTELLHLRRLQDGYFW